MNQYNLPARYRVELSLGKGGLGEVLKVFDSILNKDLALKVIAGTDKEVQRTLRNEFEILSKLDHPNLVKVYDFSFLASSDPFITMELIQGVHLREFFEDSNNIIFLPSIIFQILSALSYLHEKEILHGDIKPENIMIIKNSTDSVTTKLLDFGLSITIKKQTGILQGTPRYLAPEVLSTLKYSPSSDLFALGASIIDCALKEETPIHINLNKDYYRNKYFSLTNLLSKLKMNNSFSLSSFIFRLTQLNPSDRPKDAIEALRFLNMLLGEPDKRILPFKMPSFICRDNELDYIDKYLNQSHKRNVLLLTGNQGIGKKLLIKYTMHEAQLKGYLTIDLSGDYYIHNTLEHFINTLSADLPTIKRLRITSNHKRLLSSLTKRISTDSTQDYSAIIFDNVVQFIHDLSLEQPVIICIPDIERFGDDFLKFIYHLACETNFLGSNTKVIISHSADIKMQKEKSNFYNRIFTLSFVNKKNIKPFRKKELIILIKYYFGRQLFSLSEINNLLDQTKGIPLLIEELLIHLFNIGVIYFKYGYWYLDRKSYRETHIPNTIDDIIKSGLKSLNTQEVLLIQILAHWGRAITVTRLSRLLNYNIKLTKDIIISLLNTDIITISDDRKINIKNQIYAQAIIKHSPLNTQILINRNIAKFLELKKGIEPLRIAHHYIKSTMLTKALKYAFIAADKMLSRYEHYDCYALLTNIKSLAINVQNNNALLKILVKLSPLEYQLGLIKQANEDYKTLIKHTDDLNLKAMYLKQLALIHGIFLGQEKIAISIFNDALDHARRSNDSSLQAEILLSMGHNLGEGSIEYLKESTRLCKTININLYAKALAQLLYIYKISGKIAKVEQIENELVLLIDKVNNETKREILYKLYLVAFYKGDYEKSKYYIEYIIKIDEISDNEFGKMNSLYSLGGHYYIKGQFYKQIITLNEALVICGRLNTYLSSLTIYSNLALAYLYLDLYDEVYKMIKYAEKIIKEYNITDVPSYYLIKYSHLYSIMGHIKSKEYKIYLRKVYLRAKKTNNSIILGHRQLINSQHYYQQLALAKALKYGLKALSFFKDSDARDDIVDALINISIYVLEQDKPKEAQIYLKEARKIFNEIRCDYLKPKLLLAECILAKFLGKSDTIKKFINALNVSYRMGTRETTWQIQRELAQYNKYIGEYHKSLSCYRDAIETLKQITESIDDEKTKISYLAVPFRNRIFKEIKNIEEY